MTKLKMRFKKFSREDILALKLFNDRARQLRDSRIIRDNSLRSHISLNINRTTGLRIEKTFPDEDDLRSFLLIIRPFTLNNEPIYYYRILSIIREHIIDERCRICLNECLRIFNETIKHGGMNLCIHSISTNGENRQINTDNYSDEDIYNLLLNGYYFHQDISKVEKIGRFKDEYFKDIGGFFAKSMFIGMVISYFCFFDFLDNYIVSTILSNMQDK